MPEIKRNLLVHDEISDMLMQCSHDIICCYESLYLLLERMTSEDEAREHALITLVVNVLENLNTKITDFDTSKL